MSKDTIDATKNSADGSEWETCRITGILMQLCLEIKVDIMIIRHTFIVFQKNFLMPLLQQLFLIYLGIIHK